MNVSILKKVENIVVKEEIDRNAFKRCLLQNHQNAYICGKGLISVEITTGVFKADDSEIFIASK